MIATRLETLRRRVESIPAVSPSERLRKVHKTMALLHERRCDAWRAAYNWHVDFVARSDEWLINPAAMTAEENEAMSLIRRISL